MVNIFYMLNKKSSENFWLKLLVEIMLVKTYFGQTIFGKKKKYLVKKNVHQKEFLNKTNF